MMRMHVWLVDGWYSPSGGWNMNRFLNVQIAGTNGPSHMKQEPFRVGSHWALVVPITKFEAELPFSNQTVDSRRARSRALFKYDHKHIQERKVFKIVPSVSKASEIIQDKKCQRPIDVGDKLQRLRTHTAYNCLWIALTCSSILHYFTKKLSIAAFKWFNYWNHKSARDSVLGNPKDLLAQGVFETIAWIFRCGTYSFRNNHRVWLYRGNMFENQGCLGLRIQMKPSSQQLIILGDWR